jgi:outer membrane receptor protein involved in Fe transport
MLSASTTARYSLCAVSISYGYERVPVHIRNSTRYGHLIGWSFDDGTPLTFAFTGQRPDLEQSVFAQDLIRLGKWTINAGLRWDHYQFLLNRQQVGPRFAISRYFPSADLVLHFSYDRVFQTPSFENILLSSSAPPEATCCV